MLPLEVTKTNKTAKTPILVEQVIRRLRDLTFIANEVPINMLSYIGDDILQICACSFKNAKLHFFSYVFTKSSIVYTKYYYSVLLNSNINILLYSN